MVARYERTPAVTDLRRQFQITVGLHPGYGQEHTVHLDEVRHRVVAAHGMWMAERIKEDEPYLTGVFTDVLVGYAWPRPETGQEPVQRLEPGMVFAGEVSVLYAAHVADEQVAEMLDELAGRLAEGAVQERVYVAYRDRAWCLDRH